MAKISVRIVRFFTITESSKIQIQITDLSKSKVRWFSVFIISLSLLSVFSAEVNISGDERVFRVVTRDC